jgi:G1/S-specific cyclin PLC1
MEMPYLTLEDLNKSALDYFVYQRVDRQMIAYLAEAAQNVITCDPSLKPTSSSKGSASRHMPTPPRSPEPEEPMLPTLEEFITQLVVSSNVQVPTLMSTLVYLTRLKSKLQPMARGLRCTSHRILLAALILAAKYLNDSSPKNKHWANYSNITTEYYNFGFTRTEVNLMEKQLLFLLEWDLRITEEDLYRELDSFLEPIRQKIADKHIRKMRAHEEKLRQQMVFAAPTRFPSPPSSRGHSRSRHATPEHARSASGGSITPPGLVYGSSASSYASSIASSRRDSRATTPLESEPEPYMYEASNDSFYESPVQVSLDMEAPKVPPPAAISKAATPTRMLPYEISPEEYQMLQDGAAKKRPRRGVWGRLLGGSVAVR